MVKGSSAFIDIKVKVSENVLPKTNITNTVTISSDSTPPVTRRADTIIGSIPLNIKKTVFGAVEGLTKWVDMDEVITYNIHVDNNDNNFAATDVMITDILPQEMIFMKADDDLPGVYDANEHTYTWIIPSLGPQEDIELGITVRLKEDTPDGITVTNTATVESIETALAESSVDVKAGDGPVIIKSENIQVIPGTNIRKDSALATLMVIMEMPIGYKAKDVQNTPLYITLIGESGGATIPSKDQVVLQQQDKTYVVAVFDKGKLMLAVPGYGPKSFEITGTLADSGLFSGFITLNISRFTGF